MVRQFQLPALIPVPGDSHWFHSPLTLGVAATRAGTLAHLGRISNSAYCNILMNDLLLFICGCSLSERGEVISWQIPRDVTSWWNSGSGYRCFLASVTIDFSFKAIFFLNSSQEVSAKEEGNKHFASRKLQFGKHSSNEGKKTQTNK